MPDLTSNVVIVAIFVILYTDLFNKCLTKFLWSAACNIPSIKLKCKYLCLFAWSLCYFEFHTVITASTQKLDNFYRWYCSQLSSSHDHGGIVVRRKVREILLGRSN